MSRSWIYIQLALGMIIFGSGTPISKIVTDAFPVFIGSGMRTLFGTVVLLPFVIANRKQLQNLNRKNWLVLGGIALIGMFLFSLFMLYGMQRVPGVVGSIVMSTTPAVTAGLSVLFLKDKLNWRKSVAIGLAVVGVLVLQVNGGGEKSNNADNQLLLGSLLIFAAVCSEAGYTLLGKVATDDLSPLVIAGVASLMATVLFLPFALWQLTDFDFGQVRWQDWAALFWWGLGTLALGSVLWYRGVKQVSGSTAAGFMGVMPVSALVLSYVLLGEDFEWIHLIGFAIVFSGVLLIIQAHRQHQE